MNNMEAGREMDALVHTKVLDHHGAYRYEGAFWHEQTRHVSEDCPHYSTDIAAAWLVVKKTKDNESLGCPDFKLEDYGFWRATFFDAENNHIHGWDEADTARFGRG